MKSRFLEIYEHVISQKNLRYKVFRSFKSVINFLLLIFEGFNLNLNGQQKNKIISSTKKILLSHLDYTFLPPNIDEEEILKFIKKTLIKANQIAPSNNIEIYYLIPKQTKIGRAHV